MHAGTIKSYSDETGYGFISISSHLKQELGMSLERDLFFHASSVAGQGFVKLELLPGDTVTFETRSTPRGPQAINVKVVHRQELGSGTATT